MLAFPRRLARGLMRPSRLMSTAAPSGLGHDDAVTSSDASSKRAMSTAPGAEDEQLANVMAALATQQAAAARGVPPAPAPVTTSFATKCAAVAHVREASAAALAPPIHLASTYLMRDAKHGAALHSKVSFVRGSLWAASASRTPPH